MDGDRAGRRVSAAADPRALSRVHFGGRDRAAVDGDAAARAVITAADACAVTAVGRNRTAADNNRSAFSAVAAADARAVFTGVRIRRTVRGDIAAVNSDRAAVAVPAAADGRAVAAAFGCDRTAVDRDRSCRTVSVIAADARAVAGADGFDRAAVNDDFAAGMIVPIRADGRSAGGMGVELAGACTLAVDGQRIALGNIQALHVQRISVAQNDVRITLQTYAPVDGNVPVHVIPSRSNFLAFRKRCNVVSRLFGAGHRRYIPAARDIRHSIRFGRTGQQHAGQRKHADGCEQKTWQTPLCHGFSSRRRPEQVSCIRPSDLKKVKVMLKNACAGTPVCFHCA